MSLTSIPLFIAGNYYEMIVPLTICIYFNLFCLADIHKEKRNEKEEACHTERGQVL